MKKKLSLIFLTISLLLFLTACGNAQNKAQGKWKLDYGDYTASYIEVKDDKIQLENNGVLSDPVKIKNIKGNSFEFVLSGQYGSGNAKVTVNNDKDQMKVKLDKLNKPVTYKKVEG